MKTKGFLQSIFCILLFECACGNLFAQNKEYIVGNFTGKGLDTMFMVETCPVPDDMYGDGRRSYYDAVSSNPKIPRFQVPGVWPAFTREGDLNGDGTDEIGVVFTWWTSNWTNYYVFTLKDGEWRYLIAPVTIWLGDDQNPEDIVTSINNPKKVKITHVKDADFVEKSEIVPVTFGKVDKF